MPKKSIIFLTVLWVSMVGLSSKALVSYQITQEKDVRELFIKKTEEDFFKSVEALNKEEMSFSLKSSILQEVASETVLPSVVQQKITVTKKPDTRFREHEDEDEDEDD